MRKVIGLGLLGVACATVGRLPRTAEGDVVLEVRGAVKGGPHRLGRADLERLSRRTVRGTDPAAGGERAFEGVPLLVLVEERVDLEPGVDVAVARTADERAVVIPLPVIRHLKPVLADRADGAPLPSRLVAWPTAEQPGLARDPRAAAWWVKDVTALELMEWRRTFGPALAAPAGSDDAARRGAALFGERCISCHRMRKVGGDAGPDLTTVASRLGQGAFLGLLKGHAGWTAAPGEAPDAREAEDVWRFLEVVAGSTDAR